VSFTPRTRLNPDDPFSTLFTVTNDGAFDIENIQFACHMNYVLEDTQYVRVIGLDGGIEPESKPEIKPHKSQDVSCAFGFASAPVNWGGKIPHYAAADITLCASFRPYLWWRRKQSERFVGRIDRNGNIVEWSHEVGGQDCLHY
jgi:hypothetical protein